jgi:uncharacterized protein YqeY
MSLKTQIDQDLKTALLDGNKTTATTLRGLKGAILNVEIAEGKREPGLSDDEIIGLLQKETKKRRESIDIYSKAGETERAANEQAEIDLISNYLPEAPSEEALKALVDEAVASLDNPGMQQMGQVIGAVKQKAGAGADGALIAKLVKERLA